MGREGMIAIIGAGMIYLIKIRGEMQRQALQIMNGNMEEIPFKEIKKVFPELKNYEILQDTNYYINTDKKVLFVPEFPKRLLVAHEAGHAVIDKRNKGIKKLLNNIKYVYYPVSEENKAWDHARNYAGSGEDIDKIKKPFIGGYRISVITKAVVTVLSVVVTILVMKKHDKDKDGGDGEG